MRKIGNVFFGKFREIPKIPEFRGFYPLLMLPFFSMFQHRIEDFRVRKIRGNFGKFREKKCPKIGENRPFFLKTPATLVCDTHLHDVKTWRTTFVTKKKKNFTFFAILSAWFCPKNFRKKNAYKIFLRLWCPCCAGGGQFSLRFFRSKLRI